jgi:DeoR/GlpR family transcriptional regulator of sugar metabolism
MIHAQFIYELLPKIFKSGAKINILADSSKFYKIATFQIAPLDSSFKIFTDKKLPKNLQSEIERNGPLVII